MITHVDWFSTSLACNFDHDPVLSGVPRGEVTALRILRDVLPPSLFEDLPPEPVTPRAPYRYSLQGRVHSTRISWHPDGDHVHIELPGRACLHSENAGDLFSFLRAYGPLATRIDLACDLKTSTPPSEFLSSGYSKRFRSSSRFSSNSGETEYVGSMQSSRFARVYRYAPPHPRSDYLRIEYVFRKDYAPQVARVLVTEGYQTLLEAVTDVFQWKDKLWDVKCVENASELLRSGYTPERHESKTLRWLQKVCAPAIARLVKEGEISNLEEWIDENIRHRLEHPGD